MCIILFANSTTVIFTYFTVSLMNSILLDINPRYLPHPIKSKSYSLLSKSLSFSSASCRDSGVSRSSLRARSSYVSPTSSPSSNLREYAPMRIELSACMLVPHWSRVHWLSLEWLAARLVSPHYRPWPQSKEDSLLTLCPDSSGQLTVQLSWSEVTCETSCGKIRPIQGQTNYNRTADEEKLLPNRKEYLLPFSSKVDNG